MSNAYIEAMKYKASQENRDPMKEALSQIGQSAVSGYFSGKLKRQQEDTEFKKELFRDYLKNGILINKKTGQPPNTAQISYMYNNFLKSGLMPMDEFEYKPFKRTDETSYEKEKGKLKAMQEEGVDIKDYYNRETSFEREEGKRKAMKAIPMPKDVYKTKETDDSWLESVGGEETQTTPKLIKVYNPKGQLKQIDENDWEQAKYQGYRLYTGK